MPIKINLGSMAQTIHLPILSALKGVRSPFIHLRSGDGQWDIKVPRAAFQNMNTDAVEALLVSLTLTQVHLEEVEEDSITTPKPVILRPN